MSNTPWKATLNAIIRFVPGVEFPPWATALDPDAASPLSQIIRLIRELAQTALQAVTRIQGRATATNWNSHTSLWDTEIQTQRGLLTIGTSALIIATGGEPKFLDTGIPSIPLDVALDPARLVCYIQPGQRIAVFGIRHSGIIALRSALATPAGSVTGFYRGPVPFTFADEGDYDGLKLEGAATARAYMSAPPDRLRLRPFIDGIEFRDEFDWAVYATGFNRKCEFPFHINGVPASLSRYDGKTGRLLEAPNVWGFGLAYPSQAPDGVHWDVGIAPFLEHMSRQIVDIINT
jgi:hypothetical protein